MAGRGGRPASQESFFFVISKLFCTAAIAQAHLQNNLPHMDNPLVWPSSAEWLLVFYVHTLNNCDPYSTTILECILFFHLAWQVVPLWNDHMKFRPGRKQTLDSGPE